MSAGQNDGAARADGDLGKLAPRFRQAVEGALAECNANGLDAFVYEAYRSQALQTLYYARGRTVKPPERPVTNAPSNLYSWHGYGLAVDVISRARYWQQPESWFGDVAAIFKKHGCTWGGDWRARDLPHFQWGRCKPSPSDRAREILATQGLQAVWQAVGANLPPPGPVPAAPPAPPAAGGSGVSYTHYWTLAAGSYALTLKLRPATPAAPLPWTVQVTQDPQGWDAEIQRRIAAVAGNADAYRLLWESGIALPLVHDGQHNVHVTLRLLCGTAPVPACRLEAALTPGAGADYAAPVSINGTPIYFHFNRP